MNGGGHKGNHDLICEARKKCHKGESQRDCLYRGTIFYTVAHGDITYMDVMDVSCILY